MLILKLAQDLYQYWNKISQYSHKTIQQLIAILEQLYPKNTNTLIPKLAHYYIYPKSVRLSTD